MLVVLWFSLLIGIIFLLVLIKLIIVWWFLGFFEVVIVFLGLLSK